MTAVNLFADLESHADELAAFGQENIPCAVLKKCISLGPTTPISDEVGLSV